MTPKKSQLYILGESLTVFECRCSGSCTSSEKFFGTIPDLTSLLNEGGKTCLEICNTVC